MKCYFCQQEMQDTPGSRIGFISQECSKHKAMVLHKFGTVTSILLRVVYFIKIKNKNYEVELSPFENRTTISLINTFPLPSNPPLTPSKGSRAWGNGNSMSIATTIKKFDYVVDISPENADSKIQTIMVFS